MSAGSNTPSTAPNAAVDSAIAMRTWRGRELPASIALAIAERLHEHRLKHVPTWSQRQAADALGISQAALSDLESGRKSPSLATLLRYQVTYGLGSIEQLLGDLPSAVLAQAIIEELSDAQAYP